ncbi:MAG TPA: DUF6036 family nucleotidyltransferase [Longimicrobium sp.]|nr:DUF6036 family nucleotidyltransferase [Longimicrobium sp.]
MNREQLEHAIRAACDVANEDVVIVFGSQAILGSHPDASDRLRQSMEVDIAPGSNDPHVADRIDGALGEDSAFNAAHGFYVHGLTMEPALFPAGWERRTVAVHGRGASRGIGLCIEAHDLAASKLAAFRDKDRDFVRTLLVERLVNARKLRLRVQQLGRSRIPADRLLRWLDATVREIYDDPAAGVESERP